MNEVYRLQANISLEAGRQLSAVCDDAGMSKRAAIEYAIAVAAMASERGLAPEELRAMVERITDDAVVDRTGNVRTSSGIMCVRCGSPIAGLAFLCDDGCLACSSECQKSHDNDHMHYEYESDFPTPNPSPTDSKPCV